ncbi:MAG: acyltransferase [Rhodocyclaceae bacterium]|nr:acyltransferase [Rhodocyclaceae bacterium]
MRPQAVDFRADINGLRAIAVIAVMFFHFGITGFSGGFVGVDVFFVISGYLMTRIILGPLAVARFSLLRFYFARARRIFPALAVVCVLLLLYGWFHLSPMDFKQLAKHAGTSLLFVSNQTYWKESGYFDADAHEKWLLHTWSLSVEWQFYLIYPLLILAARQLFRWRAGMASFLWVVFIASLTWSAWLAFANPAKAFFMLPTRAWEMLAGALIFMHQGACNRLTQGRRWPEAAGIAAIIAACLLLGSDNPWPGLLALLPVAGAMLIIANSSGKTQFLGWCCHSGYWPLVVFDLLVALAHRSVAAPKSVSAQRRLDRRRNGRLHRSRLGFLPPGGDTGAQLCQPTETRARLGPPAQGWCCYLSPWQPPSTIRRTGSRSCATRIIRDSPLSTP